MEPTMRDHQDARRDLIKALFVLTAPAAGQASLAARNLLFHAERLCECLDEFYRAAPAGERDDDDPG